MARIPMWFGTEEQLKCLPGIKRFDLRAADGIQNVCYAAKIKKESFVLPYKVSLDGYVFAIDGNSYFDADPEDIAYFQSTEDLPATLPAYELSTGEQLSGGLLWPALALLLTVIGLQYFGILPQSGNTDRHDPGESNDGNPDKEAGDDRQ